MPHVKYQSFKMLHVFFSPLLLQPVFCILLSSLDNFGELRARKSIGSTGTSREPTKKLDEVIRLPFG